MNTGVFIGFSRWVFPLPRVLWQRQVSNIVVYLKTRLAFLTADHRLIHRFMVCQLTESGVPFPPEYMADRLHLPIEHVKAVLDNFERHTGLPIRNEEGNIVRAYPVTLKKTPYHMAISIGHELYANEAIGALAMPFVQKQLRGVSVSGHVTTECAYCHQPLHILVDSDLSFKVVEEKTKPVLFSPLPAAKSSLSDITDIFLRECVFYCSAEHAREHRKKSGGTRGIYLPLEQAMYINRIFQETIFGFSSTET